MLVELEEVGAQQVGVEAGLAKAQPIPKLLIAFGHFEFERTQRLGVVRSERLLAKWPTGVLDPGAPFEVDRIELNDASTPHRGRSPEKSKAALIEWVIGEPDRLSGTEILKRLFVIRRPALEYTDIESR